MKPATKNLKLILALLCCAATARAKPDDAQAQAKLHYEAGQKQVASAHWKEALAEFDAGYQLSHRPVFLFNMAECARSASDHDRARELYARFLREQPEGQLSSTAKERLAVLGPPPPSAPPVAPPRETKPPIVPAPIAVAPTPAVTLVLSPPPAPVPAKRPVWKRWPLWVGLGAAVAVSATAISLGVVYGTRSTNHCGAGCSPVTFH